METAVSWNFEINEKKISAVAFATQLSIYSANFITFTQREQRWQEQ